MPKMKKVKKQAVEVQTLDEEQVKEPVAETEEESKVDLEASKKKPKVIYLKQWIVTGLDGDGKRISVFLLATCGAKAREAMEQRYKGCQIWNVMQTAESEKTADWLKDHSPFYN